LKAGLVAVQYAHGISEIAAALALLCPVGTVALAQTQNRPSEAPHGKPRAFICNGYSWYQSGKVRVFFSAEFAERLGPVLDISGYNKEFQALLGRLFRSGALNGEMFYRLIGEIPPAVTHISGSDIAGQNADVSRAMENYRGPIIKILHYDIISRSETHFETITYEMWVTSSRSETGWGEFHRFRITAKKRFLLEPKIVNFEYLGIQI